MQRAGGVSPVVASSPWREGMWSDIEQAAGAGDCRKFKSGAGGNSCEGSAGPRHLLVLAGVARVRRAKVHDGLIEIRLLAFER